MSFHPITVVVVVVEAGHSNGANYCFEIRGLFRLPQENPCVKIVTSENPQSATLEENGSPREMRICIPNSIIASGGTYG